jgi:signal peptide peptidase SppA
VRFLGFPSAEAIAREMEVLAGDDAVQSVLLDIDSPGGTVAGVQEAADAVWALRQSKRVVAIAHSDMGSAAYWIGAQAGEVVSIPSGRVGSIGVFIVHFDFSREAESMGVGITIIEAPAGKADGTNLRPLGERAQQQIQAEINTIYGEFVKAVGRGRGATPAQVRAGYGQGHSVLAQHAVPDGLIDRVAPYDATLRGLLTGRRGGRGGPRAMAEAGSIRELEALLRDEHGLTQAEAKAASAAMVRLHREGAAVQPDDLRRDGAGAADTELAAALHGLAKDLKPPTR